VYACLLLHVDNVHWPVVDPYNLWRRCTRKAQVVLECVGLNCNCEKAYEANISRPTEQSVNTKRKYQRAYIRSFRATAMQIMASEVPIQNIIGRIGAHTSLSVGVPGERHFCTHCCYVLYGGLEGGPIREQLQHVRSGGAVTGIRS
jgi:hypothetical protein